MSFLAVESPETTSPHQLIYSPIGLSEAAQALVEAEKTGTPVNVSMDRSLRLKVLDQCGMACSFCHNEGTPVTVDNKRREVADFTSNGKSGRVSIYLNTNGVDFVSGTVHPDDSLNNALDILGESVPFDEIHLTGGEPTLHPEIVDVVGLLALKGLSVKMTSNGENFYPIAKRLEAAGLSKVIFSIFGTNPNELAAIQGEKFNNPNFAKKKLDSLEKSIVAAHQTGIDVAANIVMPDPSHAERIKSVIQRFGNICKIRILNSLDEGGQSYNAVYELLADMGATPTQVNITAGASGMSTNYLLPDGKQIGFKQIRHTYLDPVCDTCSHKDIDCDEGYYGVRMYTGQDKQYRVGVCIQRMDLTRPIDEFLASNIPAAILEHRQAEYDKIMQSIH